ncbi:EI24 domain-containing protein [Haliangium sp.]|uniref:EI24 domain-containing protein n=1 Tax=Haliangium sp. TaxID=2663208 RepID=UPI003D11FD1E
MQAIDPTTPLVPTGTPRSKGIAGVFRGLWAALRGVSRSFGNREVFKVYGLITLVLLVLTMALGGLMLWGIWSLAGSLGDGSWGGQAADAGMLDSALDWLGEGGRLAVQIAGTIIAALVAPVLAVLLMGILFPMLAEKMFFAALRPLDPGRADALEKLRGLSIPASLTVVVRVLVRFLVSTILIFAIGLVPIVGAVLAPILQFWVTAKTLSWELLDPYMSKRGMGYKAQKSYVGSHSAAALGFGLPLSFLLAIPLLGPLCFGLAQAAAPTLLCDVLEPRA